MSEIAPWLAEILAKPAVDIPEAGRAMGIKSKARAYAAARTGQIETFPVGPRRRKVATSWLRRTLALDEPVLRDEPTLRRAK
jgi:hypothetical protein